MSKFALVIRVACCLMFTTLVAPAADAAIVGPFADTRAGVPQHLAPPPLVKPRAAHLDVVSLPVLYVPTERQPDAARVLPDSLTAPASLMPSGTLAWAGIHEAATLVEVHEAARQAARNA